MTVAWNYDPKSNAGPPKWAQIFGEGERQSPIDIVTSELYEAECRLTCCRGVVSQSSFENHSQKLEGAADELGRLRLADWSDQIEADKANRRHLDSVGEEGRASPESGVSGGGGRSGSLSSVNSGGSLSPASPHQQQHHSRKHLQHQRQQHSKELQQRTRYCTSKRKLFLGYPRYLDRVQLENNGHAWQANIPPEVGQHTLLSGAPFGDKQFRLRQFHCHWGCDPNSGSEHTINGRAYSAELHFVHWNCTDFSSFEEAARQPNGLAVLGVLVQALEGEQNRNRHLDKVSSQLAKVSRPGSSSQVSLGLDLKRLFPANRWQYATYEGSLTTPPLSEVVQWLVFLNPIQCSASQLAEFRRLECADGAAKFLLENCRPVQPTNGRLVSIWSHH